MKLPPAPVFNSPTPVTSEPHQYDLTIEHVANGFIVRAKSARIWVFETPASLADWVKGYAEGYAGEIDAGHDCAGPRT